MLLRAALVAGLLACLSAAPALAAPTVTIESGPDGPTNESSPTFEFTAQNATTVECSVDQAPDDFGPCTTETSHTEGPLADGEWTFRVRATDAAQETAMQTRSFSVDTAGPAATVAGPRRTGNRRPTFQVSSPEPGATFTCKLDGRPRVACGSSGIDPYAEPFTPRRKLKPGRHKLLVTAFDALGNPGPPETFRFKVLRPPLKAGRAERTVATALRRHKFAHRVVENLERSCTRRGRFKFSCRFSSAFRGYSLKGRGPVELRRGRISYRFRVRAQGQRLSLTDENEGRFPD
jgi:Bacterial Ig-like domain